MSYLVHSRPGRRMSASLGIVTLLATGSMVAVAASCTSNDEAPPGATPTQDASSSGPQTPDADIEKSPSDAASDSAADDGGGPKTVGPTGGQLSNDGASVTIPADALKGNATISIARASAAAVAALPTVTVPGVTAATMTSEVFVLTPHGMEFEKAITIEIAHTGPGNTVLRLDDENDTTWEVVGAAFDEGVVKFPAYHFSIYAIVDAEGTPGCDPSTCTDGFTCVRGYDRNDKVERYQCSVSCSADAQCPFEGGCETPTSMIIGGSWCGKAPWRATGYCTGIIGVSACHGVDGQNPQSTTCVAGECTDTVYTP